MRRKAFLGLLALVLALPAVALAETFKHEAGGIQFDLPSGWKAEPEGEQIVAAPTTGGVSISFWVPESTELDKAIDALSQELDTIIQNPKLEGEGEEGEHNGMPSWSAGGTGMIQEQPIAWNVTILMAKSPVIVLTMVDEAALNDEAIGTQAKALIGSIKKL